MAYIGNQPTIGQYRKLDDISGSFNGSLTAFTMQVGSTNVSAGSVFQLLISLGGVIQNPGTDFTVSGSTITFTTAPAASLSFFGILMGQPLNTATPGDSTVTGAKIVDGTITGDKLAASLNVSQNESQIALFQRPSGATNFTVKSSATTTLKIDGTDGVLAFVNAGGATPAYTIGRDNTDNTLRISQNSSAPGTNDLLTITSAGRVGIGTTSPGRLLTLNGGANSVIKYETTGSNKYCETYYDGSSYYIDARNDAANGQIVFRGLGGGTSQEYGRFDISGRLLVGTTSEFGTSSRSSFYSFLQIRGNTSGSGSDGRLTLGTGASTGSNTQLGSLYFCDAAGGDRALIRGYSTSAGGNEDYPGYLTFWTNGGSANPTERMRLNSVGGLKVRSNGAANVSSDTNGAHELTTDFNGNEVLFVTNRNSTSPLGMQIFYPTDINNTANPFLTCFGSSTRRAEIRSNGGIANFQSNDANLCDEREKKNIEALDSTWGCLKNWEVKKFHYNEDSDTADKRYGVIAQQVAEHCPEVITDWVKQKAKDAVLDDDGNVVTSAQEEIVRMGVKEQQMYWMAIRALQEAQTRIETLEAEVAALKGS